MALPCAFCRRADAVAFIAARMAKEIGVAAIDVSALDAADAFAVGTREARVERFALAASPLLGGGVNVRHRARVACARLMRPPPPPSRRARPALPFPAQVFAKVGLHVWLCLGSGLLASGDVYNGEPVAAASDERAAEAAAAAWAAAGASLSGGATAECATVKVLVKGV